MVISKDGKRKRKDQPISDPTPPEIPKRTKVHAQRKFAQGQCAPTSSYSQTVLPTATQSQNSNDNDDQPTEILPNKRPKTEDFLTFLCFRGSSVLPSHLDFLNTKGKETTDVKRGTGGTFGTSDQQPSCSKSATSNNDGPSKPSTSGSKKSVRPQLEVGNKTTTETVVKVDAGPVKSTAENKTSYIPFAVRKNAETITEGKRRHTVQALKRKYQEQRLAKTQLKNIGKARSTRSTNRSDDCDIEINDSDGVDEPEREEEVLSKSKTRKGNEKPSPVAIQSVEVECLKKPVVDSKKSTPTVKSKGKRDVDVPKPTTEDVEGSQKQSDVESSTTRSGKKSRQKKKTTPKDDSPIQSTRITRQQAFFAPVDVKEYTRNLKESIENRDKTKLSDEKPPPPVKQSEQLKDKISGGFSSDDDTPLASAIKKVKTAKKGGRKKETVKRSSKSPIGTITSPAIQKEPNDSKPVAENQPKVKSIVDNKPIVKDKPIIEKKPIVDNKPIVVESIVEKKPIVESKPIEPIVENKSIEVSKIPESPVSVTKKPRGRPKLKKSPNEETPPTKSRDTEKIAKRIPDKLVGPKKLYDPELSDKVEERIGGPSTGRPMRKTKEAAAIYMELIGQKLNLGEFDDDNYSMDSFPELPNVRKTEQMENELRANIGKERKEIKVKRGKATEPIEFNELTNNPDERTITVVPVTNTTGQTVKQRKGKSTESTSGIKNLKSATLDKRFSDSDDEPLATKITKKSKMTKSPKKKCGTVIGAAEQTKIGPIDTSKMEQVSKDIQKPVVLSPKVNVPAPSCTKIIEPEIKTEPKGIETPRKENSVFIDFKPPSVGTKPSLPTVKSPTTRVHNITSSPVSSATHCLPQTVDVSDSSPKQQLPSPTTSARPINVTSNNSKSFSTQNINSILANLMPSKEESGKIFGIASVTLAQSSGPNDTKCTLGKCGSVHKPPLGPVVPTETYLGEQLSNRERRKAKVNMTHEQIQKWLTECSITTDSLVEDPLDDDIDFNVTPKPIDYLTTPSPLPEHNDGRASATNSRVLKPSKLQPPVAASKDKQALTINKSISSPKSKPVLLKNGMSCPVMGTVSWDSRTIQLVESVRESDKVEPDPTGYDKLMEEQRQLDIIKQLANKDVHPPKVTKSDDKSALRDSTSRVVIGNMLESNLKRETDMANSIKIHVGVKTTPQSSSTLMPTPKKDVDEKPVKKITNELAKQPSTIISKPTITPSPSSSSLIGKSRVTSTTTSDKISPDNKKLPIYNQRRTPVYKPITPPKTSDLLSKTKDVVVNTFGAFSPENEPSIYSFDKEDEVIAATTTPFRRQGRRESESKRDESTVKSQSNVDDDTSPKSQQPPQVSFTLSPDDNAKSASIAVQLSQDDDVLAKLKESSKKVAAMLGDGNESDSDGHTFYIPLQGTSGATGSKSDQIIQGVAVKLGTEGPEGPNQRVIMHAKLVTKSEMGTNSTPIPESMANVHEIVKSLISAKEAATGSSKSVPVGTVQPRFKSHDITAPSSSTQHPQSSSSAGALTRHNSSQSLFSQVSKTTGPRQQPRFKNDEPIKPSNNTAFPRHDDPAQMVDAPTFRPTEKEFQDPIEFIERITPIAARFGLCRIIPPASFKPECKVSDDMRFTAYNQYVHKMLHRWGPSAKELSAIKKYLATQSITLVRPPWIGGMEVDLPRLYHTVQELGGLKEVIEKKKWARVAEEMCIPKSAQDRVTKLDDIYCKYLLPYDTLSPAERQKLFDEVEADWAKVEAKARRNADRTTLSDDQASNDESEDDSDEEGDGGSMECIVKGRGMPLSQFFRIARNTMALWFKNTEPTSSEIESEFWRHVAVRDSHVCVHSGSIDSSGWGYGFPTPSGNKSKGANSTSCAKHAWNLKVLTNNHNSILRSIGPITGVTVPTLHVGMLFSACCWYRDPHGLPWIEYLHTGGSKLWYGVPDEQSTNFRAAFTSLVPTHCQNKTVWLPCDTAMVPPHMLTDRGVSLCRTEQLPGQFVVVFPRAYTSSLCTGYSISESVYFATSSWLEAAKDDFKDIHDSCEPALFSLEQLLFAIAEDSRTNCDTLTQILPMINEVYEKELAERDDIKSAGITITEKILPKGKSKGKAEDCECDTCRANLYISWIRTDDDNLYCLQHALQYLKRSRLEAGQCKLIITYNSEDIANLIDKIKEKVLQYKKKSTSKKNGK